MDNANNPLLQAALDYESKGYSVIPIRKNKKPFIKWEAFQKRRARPTRIQYWWAKWPDANIGIVTGSISDLDVVDVDSKEGLAALREIIPSDLPITTAKTPNGWHYYFKHHEGVRNNVRFIKDCDIRGEGGYVVAPPSVNEDGKEYVWLPNLALDDVGTFASPSLLSDLIRSTPIISDIHQPIDPLVILEGVPDGERNDRLFRYACRLHHQGLKIEEAEVLVSRAAAACTPPLPLEEVKDLLNSAWTYQGDLLEDENLPYIDVTEENIRRITTEAWGALNSANKPPTYFSHSTGLARLKIRQKDHKLTTETLKEDHLKGRLGRVANWIRVRGDSVRVIYPPITVVKDMLVELNPPIPYLERIIEYPIYAEDRTLHYQAGYSKSTKCYYDPDPRLVIPEVSAQPSDKELAKAVNLICEAFCDFPFISDSEKAHAIALTILPFVRLLIKGNTPLHLIEAPLAGSGKTLLADVAAFPSLGRSMAKITEGKNEEEYRKRITALLIEGSSFICIDNIRARLMSAAVSAAITSGTWKDRILGHSKTAEVPVDCAWVATGNNPALSSEVARRSIRIRIDPKIDEPWLRDPKDFKHPYLIAWMKECRGEFIHAILTIVNKWIAEGEPSRPEGAPVLGMFEEWSRVIGGILIVAGVPGFLENLKDFYADSDVEGEQLRIFVNAWWERYQDEEVGVRELYTHIVEYDLPVDLGTGKSDMSRKVSLSKTLLNLRDRQVGGYRITTARKVSNKWQWKLVKADN